MRINISSLKACAMLFALLLSVVFTGCSDDNEVLTSKSGFVQFKLYRSTDKHNETRATELDYLASAKKIEIVLEYNGSRIKQTLNLNSYDDASAEYGLRSDKLELLAGKYTVIGYYLYNDVNEMLIAGAMEDDEPLTIVAGGLEMKNLYVDVKKRGKVNFSFIKDFSNFEQTRSTDGYQFNSIRFANVEVINLFTEEKTTFKEIPVRIRSKVINNNGTAYTTTYAVSDSTLFLSAGGYRIASYTMLDRNEKLLETGSPISETKFVVTDNDLIDVEVPIAMNEAAENIKDYYALKEIFEALDGKNWYYYGDNHTHGITWDFDKEIDLWGIQPGVSLNGQGRVTALFLGAFGPKGDLPAAIGQLTELNTLDLGNHNDKYGGNLIPNAKGDTYDRMNYYDLFLKRDLRATFTPEMQVGFKEMGKTIGSAKSVIESLPKTRDVQPGTVTNGITSVPKEIGNLKKLSKLYIANGFISELPKEFAELEQLTDLEIYNCPRMVEFPLIINQLPELTLLNMASNPQLSAEEMYKGLNDMAVNGACKEAVQVLYLGYNNLEELPASFSNLVRLGMLDLSNNKIKKLNPLGKNVGLVKLYLDNNEIEEFPVDAEGYFCNTDDFEEFNAPGNKLKEFPNIFNAKSAYKISSIDLSENEIESFQGAADGKFKGVNVETLSLGLNKLKTFPSQLFEAGSIISYLIVSGNGMESFPDGSLVGKNLNMLESLDLSYNKLSKLPKEFNATKLPYLYGIDVSFNRFADFPYAPLNVSRLTIMSIRYQRNEKGERCLTTWPTGLYTCASLRAFYIGGNDLRKIDDTISPNIFNFEIRDNPNIVIDLSTVCYYIQTNQYNLVYDSSQDIRGCSILNLDN